jgi:hypothetical protein
LLSLCRSLLWAISKAVGAILLGGAVLWQVALYCGPPNATVCVHVAQGYGDLTIDDATYHVRTMWETPVVRELQPGRHVLRMSRDERQVFEQVFSIAPGEELVLVACEDKDRDDHENLEEIP